MRKFRRTFMVMAVLLTIVFLVVAGCGKKGPPRLPKEKQGARYRMRVVPISAMAAIDAIHYE